MKTKIKHIQKTKVRTLPINGGAGTLYVIIILIIMAAFGGILVGGVLPKISKLNTPQTPNNPYSCCDTGDGADCHPITEKEFTYDWNQDGVGNTYALLKSSIYQEEFKQHMQPTESFSPDGGRIFINDSNTYDVLKEDGGPLLDQPNCKSDGTSDFIRLNDFNTYPDKAPYWGGYFCVPDEQLIYVCRDLPENCTKSTANEKTPFDVYYRVNDGPVRTEISTKCPKPIIANITQTPQKIVGLPTPSGTSSLQLETFRVEQEINKYTWLSAWCKPADYFYPKEKTNIHFDVKPQGEFTYTLPQYQTGGWDFTALPNGNLLYQEKNYPYIYWDAAIPNNLITKPQSGYVVTYDNLSGSLTALLPKLGLNQRETSDFTAYWIKQLPKSKYYFIGVIPESQINILAPISISPTPESLLRVSLYFQTLNEKINVPAPQFKPFVRKGFTVIEWGAIFDTQKHPGFSCLM
jgi:hypothetical protein